jgi:hypothetical protein
MSTQTQVLVLTIMVIPLRRFMPLRWVRNGDLWHEYEAKINSIIGLVKPNSTN